MKNNILLCAYLLLLSFILSACTATKTKTIQAINTPAFQELATKIPQQLQANGFTDSENHWYSPVISLPIVNVGDTLYNHLDPSFHYDSTLKITSFSQLPHRNLTISKDSFFFEQGSDRISASLLAILDWNNDNNDDWIVSFSINSQNKKEISKKYYLLITNTESYPLKSQIIAIKDDFQKTFKVLLKNNASPMEFDIGDINLLEAPTDNDLNKNEALIIESAPNSDSSVTTNKLSE